jgi:FkbH-like protein
MTQPGKTPDAWEQLRESFHAGSGAAAVAVHARIRREVAMLAARGELPPSVRTLKIACLRGVTLEPMASTVVAAMAGSDFAASVSFGQLGNYIGEIFSPDSFLYREKFDVCIVLAPIESILAGAEDPSASFEDVGKPLGIFLDALDALASRFPGLILLCNFWLPEHVLARRLQSQSRTASRYAVEQANRLLAGRAAEHKNIAISDVDYLIRQMGASQFLSERNAAIAMQPFSPAGFQSLCRDWATLCQLHFRGAPKCIVLDCDGTLWGGILGEDGPDGIRLGETYPGICYQKFQRQLKNLKKLGFLLAINSKNNEADVAALFERHPSMALHWDDFVSIRINWQDKASNMRSIAEELNLGTDSFVFIDDNPFELESVHSALPGVACLRVPEEIWKLPNLLPEWGWIDRLRLTFEDLAKSAMYSQERDRKSVERGATSHEDYLRQLDLRMTVERFDARRHLERAVQLIQKTNQFNLTTRRHSSAELTSIVESGALVYLASLSDRFGDYGRIALAIVRTDGEVPLLDTFLMSCRAIGRKAEDVFLAFLVDKLRDLGHTELRGQYLPTAKNEVCGSFLTDHGFVPLGADAATSNILELDLRRFHADPRQFFRVNLVDESF